jgi:hypothetical protein
MDPWMHKNQFQGARYTHKIHTIMKQPRISMTRGGLRVLGLLGLPALVAEGFIPSESHPISFRR